MIADKPLPIWVVIPAAGIGRRMQTQTPKQYLRIAGKTILEHTLDVFLQHPRINGIVVVVSDTDQNWPVLAHNLARQGKNVKPLLRATGGAERADSVLSGLRCLQDDLRTRVFDDRSETDALVLVHDAARPCVSVDEINLLLDIYANFETRKPDGRFPGAILALPITDTIKREKADFTSRVVISKNSLSKPENSDLPPLQSIARIATSINRDGLWRALTPQCFILSDLISALQQVQASNQSITDEASALEFCGLSPLLVPGRQTNMKITHPQDVSLAELFLSIIKK